VELNLLNRTIPGTNKGRVRFITQPVYIVDATGHLAPSSRIVTAPAQLTSVLDQLILGPTKIESFAGYASDLPKPGRPPGHHHQQGRLHRHLESLARPRTGQGGPGHRPAGLHRLLRRRDLGHRDLGGRPEQLSLLPNRTFASVVTAKDCEALLEP
jgi:hypothetical protein